MADNVLFCWQDKSKSEKDNDAESKNDVAIYVDRIEGKPGENQLFFIDGNPNTKMEITPVKKVSKLFYAERMIAAIQELQGLSGLSYYPIRDQVRK
jgi:hypothetical protein